MFESVLDQEQLEQVHTARYECVKARRRLKDVLGADYNVQNLGPEIDELLIRLFPDDGKFNPINNDRDQALVDRYLLESMKAGVLTVLHEQMFKNLYAHLYYNALVGKKVVGPEATYGASMPILDDLFRYMTRESTPRRVNPERTHFAVVWRAALIGLEPAYKAGIRKAIHYGMSRNGTARSSVYHRGESASQQVTPDQEVIGFDPVCATGRTMVDLFDELQSQGFAPENIRGSAMIAAPEGLALVLRRRPNIGGITVGRLEGGMDEHAYLINMRVGDAGDNSADAVRGRLGFYRQIDMITDEEAKRVLERFDTGR